MVKAYGWVPPNLQSGSLTPGLLTVPGSWEVQTPLCAAMELVVLCSSVVLLYSCQCSLVQLLRSVKSRNLPRLPPPWLLIALSQLLLVWSHKSCLGILVALTFKFCTAILSKGLRARSANPRLDALERPHAYLYLKHFLLTDSQRESHTSQEASVLSSYRWSSCFPDN